MTNTAMLAAIQTRTKRYGKKRRKVCVECGGRIRGRASNTMRFPSGNYIQVEGELGMGVVHLDCALAMNKRLREAMAKRDRGENDGYCHGLEEEARNA